MSETPAILAELVAWAETVEIHVDTRLRDRSYDDIREEAINNAVHQRMLYIDRRGDYLDRRDDDDDWAPADENRAIVNLLRHAATNYDDLCSALRQCYDDGRWYADPDDGPTDEEEAAYDVASRRAYYTVRRRVHEALTRAYPRFAEAIDDAINEDGMYG